MSLAEVPSVLVVQNGAGEVWEHVTEKDFETGAVVVYRRANLRVRAEDAPTPPLMQLSLSYDPTLIELLGPETVAKELAQQMVLAMHDLLEIRKAT